jgi:hypothetical protein
MQLTAIWQESASIYQSKIELSLDFREYVTPYGLMIVFLLAGIVFQGGTFILLVGKQKARHLWRSWWFDLTAKCHPKPAKERMPRSTSSAQELQPSTSEKKTDTKN